MTQQLHSWLYIWKNQSHQFEKIHVLQCSYQHYLQLPRYESSLHAHQQINNYDITYMSNLKYTTSEYNKKEAVTVNNRFHGYRTIPQSNSRSGVYRYQPGLGQWYHLLSHWEPIVLPYPDHGPIQSQSGRVSCQRFAVNRADHPTGVEAGYPGARSQFDKEIDLSLWWRRAILQQVVCEFYLQASYPQFYELSGFRECPCGTLNGHYQEQVLATLPAPVIDWAGSQSVQSSSYV